LEKDNRAIFLDRDGVLNALIYRPEEDLWDSPYSLQEFRILFGVATAVRRIKELGFLAVVVSNQPGVAKGKFPVQALESLDNQLSLELAKQDTYLDGIYYCFHHPEGIIQQYQGICDCRKPKPGLLIQAAQEHQIDLDSSYLIGDRLVDIEAGLTAGCKSILVKQPPGSPDPAGQLIKPTGKTEDLTEAVQLIETLEGLRWKSS